MEGSFLEYGALGLLALVLVSVGTGIWKALHTLLNQISEREKFLESLVNSTLEAKEAQIDVWRTTVIEVNDQLSGVRSGTDRGLLMMDKILECLKIHQDNLNDKHARAMSAIEKRERGQAGRR